MKDDAAVAWLFTCKQPGKTTQFATVDPETTEHWPLDQWTSVEREALYRNPPKVLDIILELQNMLMARDWFEGNPEGALTEIEHRVKTITELLAQEFPDMYEEARHAAALRLKYANLRMALHTLLEQFD